MSHPDLDGRRIEIEGVEGKQRQHDREPHHVYRVHRDENREAPELVPLGSRRRAHATAAVRSDPSAKTAPLTAMRKTPYAAATPISACRRLDRISREIGRVSYV